MKKIIRRNIPKESFDGEIAPLLNRIYAARGVTAKTELDYKLQQLLSYNNLANIEQAVALLVKALEEGEHVLVVGDFDADGATSTALAVSALKSFGFANVSYLIPNRFEYGYGLSPEIVEIAASKAAKLILTVDNGIASHAGVLKANQLGIKVLITDHHLPAEDLPEAAAIINPNLHNDNFASKELAGVGVIFYLLLALRNRLREINWFGEKKIPEPNMAQFLDLVALGTVADLVHLDHNNRILVQQGLQRIRSGKCSIGIKELLQLSKRSYDRVTASDLAFVVAPRINAAGRLDEMSLGVECLLASSVQQARLTASELDQLNNERRTIEVDMQQQAERILKNLQLEQNLPLGVCIYEETWHQGVLGILASRLKDKLHRPVIAFAAVNDNEIKGSARSIAGIHMRDTLNLLATRNSGLISKFGGHAMAAGLTIPRDAFSQFAELFNAEIAKHITQENLQSVIYSDGELEAKQLVLETALTLREAGPWGHGFPEPVFDNIFDLIDQRIVGQKHLKLTLRLQGAAKDLDAIWFNIDPKLWPNFRCNKAHITYRLDVNEYQGRKNLQLVVEHVAGM